MKVLGVIPARSQSRRVKDKNIRLLGGKPLLVWTVEAAKKAKGLDRVMVSTDSRNYGTIAKKAGAEVPFIRPEEISKDVDSALVVKHALEWLLVNEVYDTDAVCLLQPTSPFRTADDIDKAIHLYESKKFDTVVSVRKVAEHSAWTFRMRKDGSLENFLGFPSRIMSGLIAQELPKLWIPNGAIYITSPTIAMNGRIYGDVVGGMPMSADRSLDIETEEDLRLAEIMLERMSKK